MAHSAARHHCHIGIRPSLHSGQGHFARRALGRAALRRGALERPPYLPPGAAHAGAGRVEIQESVGSQGAIRTVPVQLGGAQVQWVPAGDGGDPGGPGCGVSDVRYGVAGPASRARHEGSFRRGGARHPANSSEVHPPQVKALTKAEAPMRNVCRFRHEEHPQCAGFARAPEDQAHTNVRGLLAWWPDTLGRLQRIRYSMRHWPDLRKPGQFAPLVAGLCCSGNIAVSCADPLGCCSCSELPPSRVAVVSAHRQWGQRQPHLAMLACR
mmetsp:Transcript_25110/g.64151  ORF Transcript_25110/g.64151 Transcript_25110/m.64151 type:complete len:268 (-) Transcript_25110:148-951(-)